MLSVWCHIHSEVLVWFNIACFGYQVRLVSAHKNESNKKTILHSLVLERIKYTIIKKYNGCFWQDKEDNYFLSVQLEPCLLPILILSLQAAYSCMLAR